MKKNKLLGIDLDELIKESVRSLFKEVHPDESTENMKEKLRQEEKAKSAAERKKRSKSDPKESTADEGEESLAPSKPVKIKHEKVPEINVKAVADKLNSIRSGKSLKDPETKSALKAYFQKLNGPERIALFAFLSGIDKVLGDASTDVKTPHSDPFNVDMEKKETKDKKVQPKGTKEPSVSKDSENPIIVGERANVSHIKNKLWK
tara:strand:- start:10930 stop:11544 length:615 start_codon:yes stop_codon:yes gene_type:complete